ncbi:hypothetical protein Y1Q_0015623 [Alligator mississippiensis]|uniref:Uncharacterized protein n=1 Tax=Alligator mississippiensis TaxID=8496 RepID=A0A151NNT3_ALLMI|nr:hypothetical protein Y1Q_0015623 [Alligator mississippiensis]
MCNEEDVSTGHTWRSCSYPDCGYANKSKNAMMGQGRIFFKDFNKATAAFEEESMNKGITAASLFMKEKAHADLHT